MNKKFLVYSLVGLLSSGALTGFVLINSEQVQSLPAPGNSQQPRSVRVDQHFIGGVAEYRYEFKISELLEAKYGEFCNIKRKVDSYRESATPMKRNRT